MKTLNMLFILLIVLFIIFISCSKVQPDEVETPTVSGVVVSVVPQGLGYRFSAVVNGSNNPSQRVEWGVSPITSGTSINADGFLTISPIETADSLTVTATSVADRTKSGSLRVPVMNTGVVISPQDTTINVGDTVQFTATLNGVSQSFDWTITGKEHIGTSITPNGRLLVAYGETAPLLIITATPPAAPTQSKEAEVRLIIPTISYIDISPDTLRLSPGDIFTFEVEFESNITQSPALLWSVSGGVSGTRIVDNGRLIVDASQPATTLLITVASPAHYQPPISVSATVYVWRLKGIGPGGGHIFFDRGIEYAEVGDWRYLEAAPASTEVSSTWGLEGVNCSGTETGIGAGAANTSIIVSRIGNTGFGHAAQICNSLAINGHSDWFLPSKEELHLMYLNICLGGNIGNFRIEPDNINPLSWYWSSSVNNDLPTGNVTWYQRFSDGEALSDIRGLELFVRAARKF